MTKISDKIESTSKIGDARRLAEKKCIRHQPKPHGTGNDGAFRTWKRIRRALTGDGLKSTLTWVAGKHDDAAGKPWQRNFAVALAGLSELYAGETAQAKEILMKHQKRVEAERKSAEIIAQQKLTEGLNMDQLAAEQQAEQERLRAHWDAEDKARRQEEYDRQKALHAEWEAELERQKAANAAEAQRWAKYTLRGIPIPQPARDAKRRQSQGDEYFQMTGYLFFWCLERLNELPITAYNACQSWCINRRAGKDMAQCLDYNPHTVYTWLAIFLDQEFDMIGCSTAEFRKYHKDEVNQIEAVRW